MTSRDEERLCTLDVGSSHKVRRGQMVQYRPQARRVRVPVFFAAREQLVVKMILLVVSYLSWNFLFTFCLADVLLKLPLLLGSLSLEVLAYFCGGSKWTSASLLLPRISMLVRDGFMTDFTVPFLVPIYTDPQGHIWGLLVRIRLLEEPRCLTQCIGEIGRL